jgi:putative hydrolase of the HAD superfamily
VSPASLGGAPERPKTLLIDLDDTIVGYSAVAPQAWREACAPHWEALGFESIQALMAAIDKSSDWYWSDPERFRVGRLDLDEARRVVVRGALEDSGRNDDARVAAIADAFTALREDRIEPFPEALEALGLLRKTGIVLGLLTNGQSCKQRHKIDRFGLAPYFDGIFVEEEVGVGKPERGAYENALSALGAKPDSTWMAGDSLEFDVEAAQSAGLRAAWNDWEGRGLPAGTKIKPDLVIASIMELARLWA